MAKKDVRGKAKWTNAVGKRNCKIRLRSFKCGCQDGFKKFKGKWVCRSQVCCLQHTDLPWLLGKRIR